MEGFKVLINYLTSEGKVDIEYAIPADTHIPQLLNNYALDQIAVILTSRHKFPLGEEGMNKYLKEVAIVKKAVVLCMLESL